jgi:nucleotide-binding universal stress UspA family protein
VAVNLASDLEADVVALSISQTPTHVETTEDREDELEADARRLREAIGPCRSMAERAEVAFSHTVLEAARPEEALASHVIEHGFDLLVVGSHGTDHATHAGIGRVVERLLDHQPCPILVIGRGSLD